jgi:alkylation response protein AidB-like acyl-CoA dehydrogenase
MSELDLLPTDVGEDLRATVRDLLTRRCPPALALACYDGDRAGVAALWGGLVRDLGLGGLLVAEEWGGAGATTREAAIVLEELGAAVAPVPFLTSSVIAVEVLAQAAADGGAPAQRLLSDLAEGRTAAVLLPFGAGPGLDVPTIAALAGPGGVSGSVAGVAGVLGSDVLLVPVRDDHGIAVHAVDAAVATVTPVVSLDMTRPLAEVTLREAPGVVVVPPTSGLRALRRAWVTGSALLAAEQAGVARRCLDATVAYLRQRRQFGRVLGGFQALKHRLADLYVEVEAASAAATHAAAACARSTGPEPDTDDVERQVAAHLAAAWCAEVAVHAAEEAIQLHGGIGMTWEHPAHLYLKRAKADQIAFGTAGLHRARLAALIDLPAPR